MRYDSKQVQFSNRILNGSTSVNIPGENEKLKFKTVDYEYIHCRIDVMDKSQFEGPTYVSFGHPPPREDTSNM